MSHFGSKRKGHIAETQAEKLLQQNGLTTRTKNFSSRYGEIDLIMDDQDTLVFVEVRTRKNANYGSAAETVNITKQGKIIKTAQFYLINNKLQNKNCRFDVVSITAGNVEWIKQAFESY
jgi:putative endonuclease